MNHTGVCELPSGGGSNRAGRVASYVVASILCAGLLVMLGDGPAAGFLDELPKPTRSVASAGLDKEKRVSPCDRALLSPDVGDGLGGDDLLPCFKGEAEGAGQGSTGYNLLGPRSFALQAIETSCGAATRDLLAQQWPPDSTTSSSKVHGLEAQLALLELVSRSCAGFLPFPSPELWHPYADVAILLGDDNWTPVVPHGVWDKGCAPLHAAGETCIVFIHSHAINAAAPGLLQYLNANVTTPPSSSPGAQQRRTLLVSSANDDICIPYRSYNPPRDNGVDEAAEAAAPVLRSLLEHPSVVAWYGQNVCRPHPKLRPLPLGPKFKHDSSKFGEEDFSRQKAHTMAMVRLAASPDNARWRRRRSVVILLSLQSTEGALYRPHKGLRRKYVRKIEALAGSLQALIDRGGGSSPPSGPQRRARALGRQTHESTGPAVAESAERDTTDVDDDEGNNDGHYIYGPTDREVNDDISAGPAAVVTTGTRVASADDNNNATRRRLMSFPDYAAQLVAHRYAWSPPGRGLDSHRAWECLLSGCVPLLLRLPLHPLYSGLDVVEVGSYDELLLNDDAGAQVLLAQWWNGSAGFADRPASAWLHPRLFGFWHLLELFRAAGRGHQFVSRGVR